MTPKIRFMTYNRTIEIDYQNSTYILGTTDNRDTNKTYIKMSDTSFDAMKKDILKAKFKRIKGEKEYGRRN